MKQFFFLLSLFTLVASSVNAQKPEDRLAQLADKFPVEKVFLHLDRESYVAGETAWFKAYLSSEYLPDTVSTTLYVELLKNEKSVISQKILPVVLGTSAGQMELPDSLSAGVYTIRAFTPAMAVQSPDFIFKKGIYIYGRKNEWPETPQEAVQLEFFPEGGNLVAGFTGTVAFKAMYNNGKPALVSGMVKNSKGEEAAAFSSYHDGMGMFELTPVAGERYTAVTGAGQFELPVVTEKGIALTVMPHPQGIFFEIQYKKTDPSFIPAYMIGQMQHRLVFRQEFNETKDALQGVINTLNLRSGIMQVTVFNKDGMPLAERLCFVKNNEYLQAAEVLTDTINFSARGRNRFLIAITDTVQGNISVSVTDADYEEKSNAGENIISTLLLTSDIKGYVHNPAWYFSADNDSVKTATDLLMMTNGWRRFRWAELVKQSPAPSGNAAYTTLAGRATLKSTNRAFADKPLLLMIGSMEEKNKRSTHMLNTDNNGNFFMDSLLFFGKNRLLFSDVRGKKSQYIDVTLKGDSMNKLFPFTGFLPAPGRMVPVASARWQMDYDAILKEKGIMLEGVTVKAKTKTATQLLEERYSTGLFSSDGFTQRVIDLVNTDEPMVQENIFEYLKSRVPGLTVVDPDYTVASLPDINPANDRTKYRIFYRQLSTVSSMGNVPMVLYLDEIETDAGVIATLSASEIAMIKVYSSFAGATGGGSGGALAIYTKKAEDRKNVDTKSNLQFYNGYSIVKEFYEPDYKLDKASDKSDNRITLSWRPSVFINNVNPKIPVSFYNNDRTKKFKITVQGMTNNGKLISLEKIVGGK